MNAYVVNFNSSFIVQNQIVVKYLKVAYPYNLCFEHLKTT